MNEARGSSFRPSLTRRHTQTTLGMRARQVAMALHGGRVRTARGAGTLIPPFDRALCSLARSAYASSFHELSLTTAREVRLA
jgi:hypothetical protein